VYFNIVVPMSVANIFDKWDAGLGSQYKPLVLVGATALCWALWISRNDLVVDNSPIKTYWCRQLTQLQRHEDLAKQIKDACMSVESTVMQIFTSHRWRFSNRITAS
jgi:hypothetical protein